MMKRAIILLAWAACAVASVRAQGALGFDGEESAAVGIYIKDLHSGQMVAEHNASMALTPASTMKALTTATALTVVGDKYSFVTHVELRGTRQGATWRGDLVVKGCADPTLESEYFDRNTGFCDSIISKLKHMGISRVEGRVRAVGSLADAGVIPQWEVEDVAWSYGAALHGVNWRDNVFRLWPATKEMKPKVPGLKIEVRKDPDGTELRRGAWSDGLLVRGRNVANKKWCVTSTMPDPARVLEAELASRMRDAGIQVGGKKLSPEPREATELYAHRSPVSGRIFRSLMVRSDNMMAEGMLRVIKPGGSRKDAIRREKELWAERGISLEYSGIIDGSGLARSNRLSARTLGAVLEWMARGEHCEAYASYFPRAGKDGTLKNFMAKTSLNGQLALKTGSVSAVQCYAGYKLDEEGRPTHVVVVMVNGFYCPRARLREAITDYLLNIFEEKSADDEQ
ncbi:MAG: D-alanyl-D-alanine carboxypeptidase [Muribaculaceae bacterium]|nr:D-alanyl-D-alanine carboxypeptidase [Muribaculaceae bacterium]